MTNPQPSPYGPADSSRPSQSPQTPATPPQQQQQQQQSSYLAQQQPPNGHPAPPQYQPQQYAYPAPGQAPLKGGNWPGLASLIVGIVSLLIVFVPGISFYAILPGFLGIVLGGIGLSLASRPRRHAGWGMALSAVAIVIGPVMAFVLTFSNLERL